MSNQSNLLAVYPFATQDGQAIPLDILRPSGLVLIAFTDSASVELEVPDDQSVAIFIATSTCAIQFGSVLPAPLVGSTLYPDTLLVPAGQAVASVLSPGLCSVLGLSSDGQLFVQFIEKWAGLALDRQYTRK